MSKIGELIEQKEVLIDENIKTHEEFSQQRDKINNDIEKLEIELKRNINKVFKGVRVGIYPEPGEFNIFVGMTRAFTYTRDSFILDLDAITKEAANKCKELYIEYYGEL